jgi:hypothetical protein
LRAFLSISRSMEHLASTVEEAMSARMLTRAAEAAAAV